ncbi:hypothetical protein [Thiomicrospira sp.]|uniref:hypothetical protein n=1 Tax=Thiomicrospira sp. TaxID=935 RepID=UPI002F9223CD
MTEIIVAFIAAILAYLGLVLTKEQKVSEFRQKWIDEVRNDLADLLSRSIAIQLNFASFCRGKLQANLYAEFIKTHSEDAHTLLMLAERIKFRLNPNDDEGLIELLDELTAIITSPSKLKSGDELEVITSKLSDAGHRVFKTEWERVKNGEPWFYWSKWAVIVFFGLVLVFVVFRLVSAF